MTWLKEDESIALTALAHRLEASRSRVLRALLCWYLAMHEEDAQRARDMLRDWITGGST